MRTDRAGRGHRGARHALVRIFDLPNEDPRKILAVAFTLCLVCSILVSTAAVGLRPLQERNAALALKTEVLRVAGRYRPGLDIDEAFAEIETRLVDLDTGAFVPHEQPTAYSYRDAARDPAASRLLDSEDIASIRRRPNRMPVYLVEEEGRLRTLILPVYGYGLWSTMHGLLALEPDGRTAKALTFYEQRETAGLGDQVADPDWLAQWRGKTLLDAEGRPLVQIVKGRVDPKTANAQSRIDGLSGATLTAKGVNNLLSFWLGEQGFGPLLERLRQGEL